jgi:capsular polysaccharide biosynthesis protein
MIGIRRILCSVRRHVWLVLLTAAVAAGVAAALTFTSEPRYAAESLVRVEPQTVSIGEALPALTASRRAVRTYARIVASRSLAETVVTDLGEDYTVGGVMGSLSARQVEDLDLLMIRAVHGSADRAAAIANSAAGALRDYVTQIESGTRRETLVIIDPAVPPTAPFAPRPILNLIAAVLAGSGLGIVVSLVVELMRDRFFGEEELESYTGLPVLGSIPVLARRRA